MTRVPTSEPDVPSTGRTVAMESIQWLTHALRKARRRYRWHEIRLVVLAGTGISLLALVGYGLSDYLVGFPRPVRILLTLGLAAAGIHRIHRIALRIRDRLDSDEAVAREVEKVQVGRGASQRSLLIASLQFGTREGITGSMALKNEAIRRARESCIPPDRVPLHEPHHLRRAFAGAVVGLLVALPLWMAFPLETGIFLLRALGSDAAYPTATRIVSRHWPSSAPMRRDYPVEVQAEGRLPGSGRLELQIAGGKPYSIGLDQLQGQPSNYLAVVSSPLDSFRFRVLLGDAKTEWQSVEIKAPPRVTEGGIRVLPPAYTGRAAVDTSLGDVAALEGSRVQVTFRASVPDLAVSELVWGETNRVPCQVQADGSLLAELEAGGSTTFYLRLLDQDHLENTDRPRFALSVTPDQLPEVRLQSPEVGTIRSPLSQLRILALAQDDFKVTSMHLAYTISRTEEADGARQDEEVATGTLPLSPNGSDTEVSARLSTLMNEFPVRPGDRLVLTAAAEDNRPGGNRVSFSDPVTVTVVTPEELRAMILQEQMRVFALVEKLEESERQQTEAIQRWMKE